MSAPVAHQRAVPSLRARRPRLLAFVMAALLVAALLPATAGASVPESSPAGRAADWIAREYEAPDSEIEAFGTGALIDALIALAATGTEQDTALNMLDELQSEAAAYAGSGPSFNPGAAGKVVHALEVYGRDPATFVPGRDFEAELRQSMQTSGADAGRFGDSSVFSQALAIIGLSMTGGGAPTAAVEWLARAQCTDGDFTFDGSCPGFGDADSTGLATVALIAGGGDPATVSSAIARLAGIQRPDGALPGSGAPNANSTALGAQAFLAAGDTARAASAEDFLETLQFGPSAPPADAGGLKYLVTDTAANTFATIQGVWGLGVPPLFELEAPTFGFSDTANSIFAGDIEWIAAAGITRGCAPDRYCPDDNLTRGQAAAFLRRALDLPAGPSAGFTDTGGSVFAADIDAIAAAGITRGCAPDRYCPDDNLTRGQMAALLRRALDLPAGPSAGFTDTGGSVFAADIDAIAAAGITRGCAPDRYCPDDNLTRGQMAALLRRALDLPAGPSAGFTDIGGSVFAADIDAIAAAGITRGCAPDRYCPDDNLTRGQMAALLRRALSG